MKLYFDYRHLPMLSVTPFVGVWIEITESTRDIKSLASLPSWECGLKSLLILRTLHTILSLPSWECGLKFPGWRCLCQSLLSLPSWECGLKFRALEDIVRGYEVTPFVGVWIEILPLFRRGSSFLRHSLRGSVD